MILLKKTLPLKKMKLAISLVGALLYLSPLRAEIPDDENTGFVEVESPLPLIKTNEGYELLDYKHRKDSWGFGFAISDIFFYPQSYRSRYEGASFGSVFGKSDVQEAGGEFSLSWNTSMGSFGVEAGVAQFSATGGDDSFTRSLNNIRTSGSISYTMNSLFNEPYFAPYIQGGVYTMDYKEKAGDQTFSGTTSPAGFFYVGALLQLNWIEKETSTTSYGDFGLENTYLNLFAAQFMASSGANEPKFNTGMQFGVGLKLEF